MTLPAPKTYTLPDLLAARHDSLRATRSLLDAQEKVDATRLEHGGALEALEDARKACKEAAIQEEDAKAWMNAYGPQHLRGSL